MPLNCMHALTTCGVGYICSMRTVVLNIVHRVQVHPSKNGHELNPQSRDSGCPLDGTNGKKRVDGW